MTPASERPGCDLLVVIAHPDDEIFTSGVICLCVDAGLTVKIVCVTDGEGGMTNRLDVQTPEALAVARQVELDRSAAALGVAEVHRLHQADIADPHLPGGWDLYLVTDRLGAILDAEQPSVLLTHGPRGGYGNTAHKIVHNCVIAAAEKTAFTNAIYAFCGKTPGAFFSWHLEDSRDVVFDVRDAFTRRCDSLSHHYSQRDYFLQPYAPKTFRKRLSAAAGYILSTSSFGRKRIPIGTPERFFARFPHEGLVRLKHPSSGTSDRLVELFLDDNRVRFDVKSHRA